MNTKQEGNMARKNFADAIRLVLAFCLVSALSFCQVSTASARDRDWHKPVPYHFYQGERFRSHGPDYLGFFAAALAIGTIVALLPERHETVVAGGEPYYYHDRTYYQSCPSGYVVVPAPVSPDGTVTINIPNSDGSYTVVKLVKHDDGYIGPQGEYYSGHPTVEQLKVLYGK
jgi:hypothetical protein